MPTEYILFGAVVPFFIGVVTAALAARSGHGRWAGAVLLAAGYLPIHVVLIGMARPFGGGSVAMVPVERWLGWLVLLAALAGLALHTERRTLALAQRTALLTALLFALTHPMWLRGGWGSPLEILGWLVGLGLLLTLLAAGADRAMRDEGPALGFGLVALSALATAAVLALDGSAKLGQVTGGLAAAAGGAALVGVLVERRGQRPPLGASAGPVVAVALGGVLILGLVYGRVHFDALLLCAVPLIVAPRIARTRLGRRRGLAPDAWRLALLSLPLAVAVALAALRYEPSPY